MIESVIAFLGGFAFATLVAYVLRRKGIRLIRGLQRENANLLGEESRIFSFLHNLGENLNPERGPRRLYHGIVEGIVEVVDADGGAMYLADRSGANLTPAVITPNCPPLVDVPPEVVRESTGNPGSLSSYLRLKAVPVGKGLLGMCFEAHGAINFGPLRQWPDLFEIPMPEQLRQHVLAAPLVLGERNMGILAVAKSVERGGFTPHEFDVFRSAAEQSAFALGSAMAQQEAMEKKRIDDELRSASELQRLLLPQRWPETGGYHLAVHSAPAKVLSGDYYDFIEVDEGHTGVVIADVSGKGFPASLVMATCRALLRGQARGERSPTAVLSRVNRMIFNDIREDMFVSLAYCILEQGSGRVTLSRAGHDAPLLYSRRTGTVAPLKPPGLAIGIDGGGKVFDRSTRDFVFEMDPGDCLLLYTDGVNEAVDASGDEFGLARLNATFSAAARSGARGVVEEFQRALAEFTGGTPLNDDVTIVVLERTGTPDGPPGSTESSTSTTSPGE